MQTVTLFSIRNVVFKDLDLCIALSSDIMILE